MLLFSWGSCVWFGYQGDAGVTDKYGNIPFSVVLEVFKKGWYSSFKHLVEFLWSRLVLGSPVWRGFLIPSPGLLLVKPAFPVRHGSVLVGCMFL